MTQHQNWNSKTYLINLDSAIDRYKRMAQQLSDLHMPYERISAVNGRLLSFPHPGFDELSYTLLHGRRRNPAEIGCYLSHLRCAEELLASGADYALILEDDLVLPVDLQQILASAELHHADWDILRLSTVNKGRKYAFRQFTPDRMLAVALTREKGSGAYVINRRAARWFVEALSPMRLPFDLAFDLEFFAGLKAAFVLPVPISQSTGLQSQIQGRRRSFHLSRIHYLTVMPYRVVIEGTRICLRLRQLVTGRFRSMLGAPNGRARYRPIAGSTQAE